MRHPAQPIPPLEAGEEPLAQSMTSIYRQRAGNDVYKEWYDRVTSEALTKDGDMTPAGKLPKVCRQGLPIDPNPKSKRVALWFAPPGDLTPYFTLDRQSNFRRDGHPKIARRPLVFRLSSYRQASRTYICYRLSIRVQGRRVLQKLYAIQALL